MSQWHKYTLYPIVICKNLVNLEFCHEIMYFIKTYITNIFYVNILQMIFPTKQIFWIRLIIWHIFNPWPTSKELKLVYSSIIIVWCCTILVMMSLRSMKSNFSVNLHISTLKSNATVTKEVYEYNHKF